jgi:hypothetical protein
LLDSSDHYLFNPWTGETILANVNNLSLLDRSKSMWAKPDKYPSEAAKTIQVNKLKTYENDRYDENRIAIS